MSDLQRFVSAQDADGTYERALAELRSGRKQSHWMWFVFPQIAGLGRSETARRFALASVADASAYVEHTVLGPRLLQSARAVLEGAADPSLTAERILGAVDALKLRSSMTLFLRAAPKQTVFSAVLDRFFDGEPDPGTLRILGG